MREIKATGKVFVVPNHASKVSERLRVEDHYKMMAEYNDLDQEADEHLVETWIVSDDLGTENLGDHGFRIVDGDKELFGNCYKIGLIPYSLLKEKKEGDKIELKYVAHVLDISNRENPQDEDALLNLTLELDQTDYRYKGFGRFEDVLERVIK